MPCDLDGAGEVLVVMISEDERLCEWWRVSV